MFLLRMVSMTQGKWSRLSPSQRADIWIRWKAGQTLHEIGRAYGKPHPTIRKVCCHVAASLPSLTAARGWHSHSLSERTSQEGSLPVGRCVRLLEISIDPPQR